jgi:TonB family protein
MPYPVEARDVRVQGVVKLQCVLNSDGSIAEIKVLLGHPIFLKAVLENARQWRFATGGKPTASPSRALLNYEFKLTDPVCDSRYKEQFVFDQPSQVLVTSQFPCWRPDAGVEKRQ